MSYFAEPNFIKYDEWFDDDLEKNKHDIEQKKIKKTSTIHDFFYEQSNYKIGGSENNLQLEIKVNSKELISNNYFENTPAKKNSVSNKNIGLFKNVIKSNLKFNITKKLIYSLSIFGFVLIFGFLMFYISQSRKSDPDITNKSFSLEKEF